jgi:hypothetical protein
MRTRTIAYPDCPLIGKSKSKLPCASATEVRISAPDSSCRRAPAEAVPSRATVCPQNASVTGVSVGGVDGALLPMVNGAVHSPASDVPATSFAAVVTRSV